MADTPKCRQIAIPDAMTPTVAVADQNVMLTSGGRATGKEVSERGVLRVNTHQYRSLEKQMKIRRILIVFVALGALGLSSSAFARSAHSRKSTIVMTRKTKLGTILVTSSGRSLYLDASDKNGHPACTSSCLTIWPPLKATGTVKAEGGAKAADLGTTKIAGGIRQVTYNGHPLYTFASDTKSGQTTGEGQNGFYVVSPSGNKITKPTKTSTGNYGY